MTGEGEVGSYHILTVYTWYRKMGYMLSMRLDAQDAQGRSACKETIKVYFFIFYFLFWGGGWGWVGGGQP